MTPENYLAKAENYKKDIYLQDFLDHRHYFTPMVYSADRIPRAEALSAQIRLATLLILNLKQKFSELCGFLWESMSLEIVRSNSLFPRGGVGKRGLNPPATGYDGWVSDGTACAMV